MRDIVSQFRSWYDEQHGLYHVASRMARDECVEALGRHGIRAMVTHRAKDAERLEAKLRERQQRDSKTYATVVDMVHDIVDLAGVRVALYFPSDAEAVGDVLRDRFEVETTRTFPAAVPGGASSPWREGGHVERGTGTETGTAHRHQQHYQRRFAGYSAEHYRVKAKPPAPGTEDRRVTILGAFPQIEIQVTSVLMHAWAEIEHGLRYKQTGGAAASDEELRLLDAVNGQVQTAEIMLEQLKSVIDKRGQDRMALL